MAEMADGRNLNFEKLKTIEDRLRYAFPKLHGQDSLLFLGLISRSVLSKHPSVHPRAFSQRILPVPGHFTGNVSQAPTEIDRRFSS